MYRAPDRCGGPERAVYRMGVEHKGDGDLRLGAKRLDRDPPGSAEIALPVIPHPKDQAVAQFPEACIEAVETVAWILKIAHADVQDRDFRPMRSLPGQKPVFAAGGRIVRTDISPALLWHGIGREWQPATPDPTTQRIRSPPDHGDEDDRIKIRQPCVALICRFRRSAWPPQARLHPSAPRRRAGVSATCSRPGRRSLAARSHAKARASPGPGVRFRPHSVCPGSTESNFDDAP